ncbi:hypothetical protein Droror1_Dr00028063 [Drosera rotundifolia]
MKPSLHWQPTINAVFLLILCQLAFRPTSGYNPSTTTGSTYIAHCCRTTMYPQLCFKSLSCYAAEINNNPRILANKALSITLSSAKSTSVTIKKLSGSSGLTHREAGAMADCVSVVSDSVYELQRSIVELSRNGGAEFARRMRDVQTWVSAALTDENTCMDGFDEGKIGGGGVKKVVRGKILKVAHLTSVALALVNNFASNAKA